MLHSHFDRRYYDGESILSARYTVPAQKTRGLRWWQQTVFSGPRDPVDRLASHSLQRRVSAHAVRKQYQVVTVPARARRDQSVAAEKLYRSADFLRTG